MARERAWAVLVLVSMVGVVAVGGCAESDEAPKETGDVDPPAAEAGRGMSFEDWAAEARADFARYDANGDGSATRGEYEAIAREEYYEFLDGIGRQPSELRTGIVLNRQFNTLDSDSNGVLTSSELVGNLREEFEASDLDGDGFVTQDEVDELVRRVREDRGGDITPDATR